MLETSPSSSLHGLTTQEALEKLDAEIHQTYIKLQNLQTLRNSIVPISQLSDDVLSQIFLHCHENDKEYPHKANQLHMRLIVSWICRHWRNVAVATPPLWCFVSNIGTGPRSRPVTLNQEYFQACMTRSGQVGKVMNLGSPSSQLLSMCISSLPSTRELIVQYPLSTMLDQTPFPALPTEKASSLVLLGLKGIDLSNRDPVIPNVERIELDFCTFNWGASFFQSSIITRLHIKRPGIRIPISLFLTTLKALPRLVDGSFRHILSNSDVSDSTTALHLPLLEKLGLMEHDNLLFVLLRALHLPHTHITIHPVDPGNSFESFLQSFKEYQERLSPPASILEVRRSPPFFALSSSTGNIDINRYTVKLPGTGSWMFLIFRHLTQNLEIIHTDFFAVSFDRLPKLRVLNLSGIPDFQTFTSCLRTEASTVAADIPFPALEELTVEKVHETLGGSLNARLYTALHSRRTCQLGLRRLHLIDSNSLWSGEYLDKLRQVVEEVIIS